jgi:hypothetical protein
MTPSNRVLAACLLLACLSPACPDPDRGSGGDADRHQAKPLVPGRPEADSFDGNGDRTDWKVLELADTGLLTVELVLDNADANCSLALFDRYGQPVSRVSHRRGDGPSVKVSADVGLGRYFVRVAADGRGDRSGYTVNATMR